MPAQGPLDHEPTTVAHPLGAFDGQVGEGGTERLADALDVRAGDGPPVVGSSWVPLGANVRATTSALRSRRRRHPWASNVLALRDVLGTFAENDARASLAVRVLAAPSSKVERCFRSLLFMGAPASSSFEIKSGALVGATRVARRSGGLTSESTVSTRLVLAVVEAAAKAGVSRTELLKAGRREGRAWSRSGGATGKDLHVAVNQPMGTCLWQRHIGRRL